MNERGRMQSLRGVLLVVDDEEEVTRSLKRIFRKKYEVHIAHSAHEGLGLMKDLTVHVVITDQRMPEMTGTEFLKEIKERHPASVRLLLTGYSDLDAVVSAINDGQVYHYLTKPWDPVELTEIVEDAFERYRLRADNERLMRELETANETLENRVAERTAALVEAKEEVAKREALYRLILDHSPLGIMHFDGMGILKACNDKAMEILDLKPAQAPGLDVGTCLETSGSLFDALGRCLKGQSAEAEGFWENRFLRAGFNPVVGSGSAPEGGVGIIEDITEKKRLLERAARNRNLEALKDFSGGISHDFNNLLASILGNIDLMEEGITEDSGLSGLLEDARIASRKAAKLVKRFYSFSRVDHLVKRKIDVRLLVGEAAETTGGTFDGTVLLDLPHMALPVNIDRQKTREVFLDLLENAVEATSEGGTIEVSAGRGGRLLNNMGRDNSGKDMIWVSFKDSGNGIAESHMHRVLNPYFSTKDRGSVKGMGLTLAIAHSILKNQGGDLLIDSTKGAGTCVTVILPAADSL